MVRVSAPNLEDVVDAVRNGDIALLSSMAGIARATNHLFVVTGDEQGPTANFLVKGR